MLYDIFLSHASDDNDLAQSISKILREAGLQVFCTVPGDPPGLWRDEVRTGLEQSEWFWLLLTDKALSSTYVHNEFGYFYGYNRIKLRSTDIRLIGRKLRYIARPGTPIYGMYEHFQAIKTDSFDSENIARIILQEISTGEILRRTRNPIPVRELMKGAQYVEAIEEYTRQIEADPAEHTKYIGRARAKYKYAEQLYGEPSGSPMWADIWEDIGEAERLQPGDRRVQNFKKSVLEDAVSASGSRPEYQNELERGNKLLERAEWREAVTVYQGILEHGISYQLNVAMAYLCGNDIPAAQEAIAVWEQYSVVNPVVRIFGLVLRAVIAALENREETGVWNELHQALSHTTYFNLRRSPLKSLQSGLARTGVLLNPDVRRVFEALPGNDVANLVGDE